MIESSDEIFNRRYRRARKNKVDSSAPSTSVSHGNQPATGSEFLSSKPKRVVSEPKNLGTVRDLALDLIQTNPAIFHQNFLAVIPSELLDQIVSSLRLDDLDNKFYDLWGIIHLEQRLLSDAQQEFLSKLHRQIYYAV